jgi:hypothetical protein
MTLETIRAWLGSTRATIVPVLDLGRGDAEDEHDPPEWMRESVVLRRRPHRVVCRPRRRRRAGQTGPSNRRWGYRRERDGTYTWRGPRGLAFTVTRDTTTRLSVV